MKKCKVCDSTTNLHDMSAHMRHENPERKLESVTCSCGRRLLLCFAWRSHIGEDGVPVPVCSESCVDRLEREACEGALSK